LIFSASNKLTLVCVLCCISDFGFYGLLSVFIYCRC